MFDAGIVTFVPKGDWVNNVTYYPLNIVNYNGLSWIARRENVGQTPADGQYWMTFGSAVPIATTSTAGIVIPDGITITVDQYGHISAVFSADLDDLDNVNISTPTNGQVLKYDAATQKWVNGTDTGGLIPHVIVISETGSTVTVSKGAWSTTATETSTGHFECDVPEFGTYTIDAVLGGDDAQVSLVVDAVKIYTVDDSHFHADITVTFPSGSTCSCGKAGETPTYATTSPHTFTVHSTGVYTVSATDGSSTATDTVTITTSGQTESVTLSFVPNGSTVVPTDDIQTLLHCANIWDKAYTTLADLLADSTSLLAVTSNSNAVDYLVRSTTFATDFCADSTAMTDIGANNYCADTLLADSTWLNAICNSTYFESVLNVKVPTMTSNTTPEGTVFGTQVVNSELYNIFNDRSLQFSQATAGCYVGYTFTRSVKVYKAKISQNQDMQRADQGKIQGSNDGTNWTDLTNAFNVPTTAGGSVNVIFSNVGDYTMYRYYETINATIASRNKGLGPSNFYGRESVSS